MRPTSPCALHQANASSAQPAGVSILRLKEADNHRQSSDRRFSVVDVHEARRSAAEVCRATSVAPDECNEIGFLVCHWIIAFSSHWRFWSISPQPNDTYAANSRDSAPAVSISDRAHQAGRWANAYALRHAYLAHGCRQAGPDGGSGETPVRLLHCAIRSCAASQSTNYAGLGPGGKYRSPRGSGRNGIQRPLGSEM